MEREAQALREGEAIIPQEAEKLEFMVRIRALGRPDRVELETEAMCLSHPHNLPPSILTIPTDKMFCVSGYFEETSEEVDSCPLGCKAKQRPRPAGNPGISRFF